MAARKEGVRSSHNLTCLVPRAARPFSKSRTRRNAKAAAAPRRRAKAPAAAQDPNAILGYLDDQHAREKNNVNESLLDAINGLAGRWDLLDSVGRFCANDLIYIVLGILLLLGLRELFVDRQLAVRAALAAVIAIGASLLIGVIIGHFWFEARPFITHPDTVRLIPHSADNAFPSDHALVAGAAATVGVIAWPRWGWLAVVGAILLCLARVFVGIHYPGDVLAGLAIGAVCAILAWWGVSQLILRTGFLAPPPSPTTVKGPVT